ncbi:MAG: hypothetical protein PHS54_01445 [Clostridia bacterium]|nr:hypothetical protein [Clostridia bacterium]
MFNGVCQVDIFRSLKTYTTIVEDVPILKNRELINCLIHYESGGFIYTKGNAGERGILQFLPSTFKLYCIDKYKLEAISIYDTEVQKRCADLMIQEGQLHQWTTYVKCI